MKKSILLTAMFRREKVKELSVSGRAKDIVLSTHKIQLILSYDETIFLTFSVRQDIPQMCPPSEVDYYPLLNDFTIFIT